VRQKLDLMKMFFLASPWAYLPISFKLFLVSASA